MRGAMNGRGLLPNPNSSGTDPSYPPGFDTTRLKAPPPGGGDGSSHVTNSYDQSSRVEKVADCGPSQSRGPGSVGPETLSEGGPSALLLGKEKSSKKRKKLACAEPDAQPNGMTYERATKACHKLWKDLDSAIQRRERDLRQKEASVTPNAANRKVLKEDKKQTVAMKNEIMEERRRLEEEAQRLRKEKDAMERTSTELAVQVVELKQERRQLEKEKAELLARKAELSAKERCSYQRDCVNAIVDPSRNAVKTDVEEAAANPLTNLKPVEVKPVTLNR